MSKVDQFEWWCWGVGSVLREYQYVEGAEATEDDFGLKHRK